MRAVIQRVSRAAVTADGVTVGEIADGLLVLLGIHAEDGDAEISWMAEKIANLRVFADNDGKMNLSLLDIAGEMLIVSQFTLYGDCRKGRRPGYSTAAPPETAEPLYHKFITQVQALDIKTATGQFGAMMQVTLTNDGPVTLLLDSDKIF
ncbi:D-aminoacyl-tRNA deacylase [Desulfopila inferna]|uniref:D-aminoacyl-tRNA deacylase n=1 Tax=Desulfopila inferna TaxID=468528 RepID=UPI0019629180|nr:D-aminoacyl-tRNA deacylase [Desulfopila inferna]MBM9604807.1 D-tyrosyl-tRNA(Tyr) deacylase [Desulfopila inferna]